jgi:EAL domain-containing protein (putative c-di-GMP-specific phosphodiesterase class I)/CHASE2 domain-containing sensor protein
VTLRPLLRVLVAHERAFAVLVAAVVGLALLVSGLGIGIEKLGSDLRAGFALHPASGQVAVIEVDARSISALRRWPWPRTLHAAMVDRLRASGAKLIAFDVDFSGASDPAGDAALAAALRRAGGGVLLPAFRQEVAFGAGGRVESAPIPSLAASAFLAAANVRPDADGRLRRMPYGLDILGAPRPSLAAMLAERPGAAEADFPIDLHVDPGTLPRFSAVDLIEGRIPAERLAGKRVVIGGTAVELGDRYSIPGFDMLPGVVVQAMAAETLLSGRAWHDLSPDWLLLLALALLPLLLKPRPVAARAVLFGSAAALLLFLPSLLERTAHATVAIVPALGAFAAAAAGAAARTFALRYRQRLLTDRETGLPNLVALIRDGAPQARLTIGAVRIGRIAERVSSGGGEEVRAQMLRLAERLRFATGANAVYRTGPGTLVWLMPEPALGEDPLSGIAALLRAAAAGEEGGDLQPHFGIASGAGIDAGAIAASAALAAEQAAAKGLASHVFTAADADAVRRDEALLARFETALAEHRIRCVYQPKRDLRSGRLKGVEALARWQDPEFGAVPPDVFIPLLERYGGIVDLTAAILADSLEAVAAWNALGAPFSVAVNLSAALLQDAGAMLRLRQMFLSSGVPGAALVVEVTETAAMSDPERALAGLAAWRDLGVAVSIDDYGTGHSSLTYLQRLPATELKIDGSFVRNLASDQRSAIMVRSTIAMAHELGLEIVAEGVEDEAVLELLRTMGCDIAQGWAIGRPVTAEEITALLVQEFGGVRRAS